MIVKSIVIVSSLFVALMSKVDFNLPHEKSTTKQVEEKKSQFPGGITAWIQFLKKNLNANTPIKKNAPEGQYQVLVRFEINTDGSVFNVKAFSSHGYGMEEEAIRVICKSPKWIPAMYNGIAVVSFHHQPIKFVVPKEKGSSRRKEQKSESFK